MQSKASISAVCLTKRIFPTETQTVMKTNKINGTNNEIPIKNETR